MLGSDLLQRGGPPYYPGTSFSSSTTGFSQYGCGGGSFSTRTEAEAGPRNKDLETGVEEESDPTPKNWEMRRQLEDNYRTSPGRHGAGSRQLQGFGPERVNKDGEGFLFF